MQSPSYTPLSKFVIFILNYIPDFDSCVVDVFPSRLSIVGMNMSLSTLRQLFQFNISLYQYLILFCFWPHVVDICSDHVSSGSSGNFRLSVSQLACSVSMNSYWLSFFFSQFGREINLYLHVPSYHLAFFSCCIYIHISMRHWMELGKLMQARHNVNLKHHLYCTGSHWIAVTYNWAKEVVPPCRKGGANLHCTT